MAADPVRLCLLRGVNVGGVVLKMEDLRALLADLGYGGVRTFIQSGNALFTSGASASTLEAEVASALGRKLGRDMSVFVLPVSELAAALAVQPFDPGLGGDKIYLTLTDAPLDGERLAGLLAILPGPETFRLAGPGLGGLAGRLLYGAYPAGYGSSKYANNYLEKYFGVRATTRNLNTMGKLLGLAREIEAEA